MNDEDNVVIEAPVDRRAAIEAAFNVEESRVDPPVAEVKPSSPNPTAVEPIPTQKAGENPTVEAVIEPKPDDAPTTPAFSVDKPPQSWRGPQKAKWAALDPEVRQEVVRREREITRTLGETSQARQFATQFAQTIQPFQARLQSLGAAPMVAVERLLQADYALSTAPKTQRAALMAKLISDYDIDVVELDAALSGKGPADPVASRMEQMLQQRLAPIQQFLTAQQQREQQQREQSNQEMGRTLDQMAEDPKYPHFEELKGDMADVIELSAKKGLYLSLEQAYSRAIAMNPEVNQQVAAQREAEAKKAAAQNANAKAQRALKASVSVGGSPSGVPAGTSVASDRRATIAAALDAVGGR
jgi:hypothetical protein